MNNQRLSVHYAHLRRQGLDDSSQLGLFCPSISHNASTKTLEKVINITPNFDYFRGFFWAGVCYGPSPEKWWKNPFVCGFVGRSVERIVRRRLIGWLVDRTANWFSNACAQAHWQPCSECKIESKNDSIYLKTDLISIYRQYSLSTIELRADSHRTTRSKGREVNQLESQVKSRKNENGCTFVFHRTF